MSSTPVEVHRTGEHIFTGTNGRGAQVVIGREGAPESFTPGELLLVAIASCAALTSENLLIRRIGDSAKLTVHADRSKDPENPHEFSSVETAFDVDLSAIEDATERSKLVEAVERTIERFCTVSRTVERGAPITLTLPR